jgi:uncharacterized protein YdaU (DUF1376 family)
MSLPYFKIHPPDYLNDYAYQRLTNEEFGVLMRLYMLMWQSNMMLHDDDINIAWQLRLDPQAWAKIKAKMIDFGILLNEHGSLINSAMKTKYLGAERYSHQQAEKRKKRKKST